MKRKDIIVDLDINLKEVTSLIEKLDKYDKINLHLTSDGGFYSHYLILLDYLNRRRKDIKIFMFDDICSCAALLLVDFKGYIELREDKVDLLLFHKISRKLSSHREDEWLPNKDYNIFCNKLNKLIKGKLKKILTRKELKKFSRGYDVVIRPRDFKKKNIKYIKCQ